jgi:hypothetical protein
MARKPQLNSLERFRKQPGRLVLEEHSHCEVPAGCGGVILRWRNPHAPAPFVLYQATQVTAESFVDGVPPTSARLYLAPGRHVLSLHMPSVDLSESLLLFAAVHDPQKYQPQPPSGLLQPVVSILSAGDGTWKFTLETPVGNAWRMLDFDDRQWLSLAQVSAPPRAGTEAFDRYAVQLGQELGAACLGLPNPPRADEAAGAIWIRKVFDIPAPQDK